MLKKLKSRKGFTLAELLIVVAIIAVLTAIAIPVFAAQLEKSREATDLANVRSAYAELVSGYLADPVNATATVAVTQRQSGWQTKGGEFTTNYAYIGTTITVYGGDSETKIAVPAKTSDVYTLKISNTGVVTVE